MRLFQQLTPDSQRLAGAHPPLGRGEAEQAPQSRPRTDSRGGRSGPMPKADSSRNGSKRARQRTNSPQGLVRRRQEARPASHATALGTSGHGLLGPLGVGSQGPEQGTEPFRPREAVTSECHQKCQEDKMSTSHTVLQGTESGANSLDLVCDTRTIFLYQHLM